LLRRLQKAQRTDGVWVLEPSWSDQVPPSKSEGFRVPEKNPRLLRTRNKARQPELEQSARWIIKTAAVLPNRWYINGLDG
jgi:hypothetical protein